jgi:hypothetical protein
MLRWRSARNAAVNDAIGAASASPTRFIGHSTACYAKLQARDWSWVGAIVNTPLETVEKDTLQQ